VSDDSQPMKAQRLYVGLAVLAALLATALHFGPALLRADIFEDDAAHHIFWLYRYSDPALFPGDLSVDALRINAPLGYRAVYATAAQLMDVAFAAKLLGVALLLLSFWLTWKVATAIGGADRELRGLLGVASLSAIIAYAPAADLMGVMALQRTFALPLTLLCLWALIAKRYAWVGGAWLAGGLFYPVVLPTLGVAAGCVFLRDMARERRMPEQWVLNGVLGLAAIGLALFGMPKAGDLGPAYTFTQAMTMPEWGPGGRIDLYFGKGSFFNWAWNQNMGLAWSVGSLLAFTSAVVVAWLTGQRRLVPLAAWTMLAVGLAWWLALRLFPDELMFFLYVPNRHARWVVGVFGTVALVAAGYGVLQVVVRRQTPQLRELLSRWFAVAAAVGSCALLLPHALQSERAPVDKDLEQTYAFLASLPKTTLIAAHPDLADYIPLRARRSVLASSETSMPWLKTYFETVKPRVEASLRAAYAPSMEAMDRELAPYGVDVFVTGPDIWQKTGYFQPYDSMVQDLLARGRTHGFALQHPPEERILFRSGEYYVIRTLRNPAGSR